MYITRLIAESHVPEEIWESMLVADMPMSKIIRKQLSDNLATKLMELVPTEVDESDFIVHFRVDIAVVSTDTLREMVRQIKQRFANGDEIAEFIKSWCAEEESSDECIPTRE